MEIRRRVFSSGDSPELSSWLDMRIWLKETIHCCQTMALLILDLEKDISRRSVALLCSFDVCVVRYDMIHLEVKGSIPEVILLDLLSQLQNGWGLLRIRVPLIAVSWIGGSGDRRRKWEEMGERAVEREKGGEREGERVCCFCLQNDIKRTRLEICQKIYRTEDFRVKNLHRKRVIFDIC